MKRNSRVSNHALRQVAERIYPKISSPEGKRIIGNALDKVAEMPNQLNDARNVDPQRMSERILL